ncbi:MAG: thioredoxin domain-containing protein, partial [Bifidobacteriaceae bacterium]|nr:thioredoxin domain-containing protein [Bifidobacteriaceae bacterium]
MNKISDLKDVFVCELNFSGKDVKGRKKLNYTIFIDFLCPYCGKFHFEHGNQLKRLLDKGYINIKLVPLAWIDFYSNGFYYSVRSAHAAKIIYENQPEVLWDFIELILKKGVQPKEAEHYNESDGSNETLAKNAKKVGANKSVVNYILQIDPNDDFGKRLLAESKSLIRSNM